MYEKNSKTVTELKNYIYDKFRETDENLWRTVCQSVLDRCEECCNVARGHFEHQRLTGLSMGNIFLFHLTPSHGNLCLSHPIPRDFHYNVNMEYSLFKIIKFMKVTKIKQEILCYVTAAHVHQVKTASLFQKLPTTVKDIMLILVTHQNVILYKKKAMCIYLFIRFPTTK